MVGYVQVVVLYVEMEESVRRQMLRATMAAQHNKRAADAGSEDIWNVRTTDVDDKKCRRRYEVFRVSRLLAPHTLTPKRGCRCMTLHFSITRCGTITSASLYVVHRCRLSKQKVCESVPGATRNT